MKKIKYPLFFLFLMAFTHTYAQVQIDKAIQMTGSGADAAVGGIKSVTNPQDATSAETIQSGSLVSGVATGSGNNFILTLTPAISSYQTGMSINFISNQNISGPTTLNVNGLGAKSIKKAATRDLDGCEILNGQAVNVIYDGTNFQLPSFYLDPALVVTTSNAGSNQLGVPGTTVTLAANTPTYGTGAWSIVSGTGGSFSNAASPTSNFTGVAGNSYVLKWTISSQCSSSSSTISVSFVASKKVFVSSATYNGNLGGYSGANAKCQALASAAGLSGTFYAWNSNPASTFSHSPVPYVLVNNTVIANNWAGLISGSLLAPINIDQNGVTRSNNVWTGTNSSGNSAGADCSAWTNSVGSPPLTSGNNAYYGDTGATNSSWSSNTSTSGGAGCGNGYQVYACSCNFPIFCFEQ